MILFRKVQLFSLFAVVLVFCAQAASRGKDEQTASYGFLDVTKPPYNVDNTGNSDVTDMLQSAIDFARLNYFVVYLPLGTYLVSDT